MPAFMCRNFMVRLAKRARYRSWTAIILLSALLAGGLAAIVFAMSSNNLSIPPPQAESLITMGTFPCGQNIPDPQHCCDNHSGACGCSGGAIICCDSAATTCHCSGRSKW
jgi:hypothetical protein